MTLAFNIYYSQFRDKLSCDRLFIVKPTNLCIEWLISDTKMVRTLHKIMGKNLERFHHCRVDTSVFLSGEGTPDYTVQGYMHAFHWLNY